MIFWAVTGKGEEELEAMEEKAVEDDDGKGIGLIGWWCWEVRSERLKRCLNLSAADFRIMWVYITVTWVCVSLETLEAQENNLWNGNTYLTFPRAAHVIGWFMSLLFNKYSLRLGLLQGLWTNLLLTKIFHILYFFYKQSFILKEARE